MATDAEILALVRGAQDRANIKVALEGISDATVSASTTTAGIVELATNAEARAGSSGVLGVVPSSLANVIAGLKPISFDGRNGAGACTLVGAAVGDIVIGVFGLTEGALGRANASYETTITIVDQIQQSSASNLSANNYVALLKAVA